MGEFYDRLTIFIKRSKELAERRLLNSNANWSFNLKGDEKTNSLEFQIGGPDEEDLRSFLLVFRQFILKNEPIFIQRIFNDCIRNLEDGDLKNAFISIKEKWNQRLKGGPIAVVIGNKNITAEYAFDLWINGYYFHNDVEKANILEKHFKSSIPLMRLPFVMSIPDLANIILYTSHLIQVGINGNQFSNDASSNFVTDRSTGHKPARNKQNDLTN